MKTKSLIELSGISPIAGGSNRRCYPHPNDPNLCIKVVYSERLKDKPCVEYKVTKQVLKKFPHAYTVSNYCEYVQTDLGLGTLTQLFHLNGKLAPNLEQYLKQSQNQGQDHDHNLDEISQSLKVFFQHLAKEAPLIKSIRQSDLVVADSQDINVPYHIRMIDDFGAKTKIPLDKWFLWARKRCVRKRIRRFYKRWPYLDFTA